MSVKESQDFTIYCDECKFEFSANSVNIKETIIELNGVFVTLVYFTCPKCNKIYKISIQDKRYYELKDDLEKTIKRIRKNHGKINKEKAAILNDMVFKKKNRLALHVQRVNKMFPGTFVFVASENNHEEKSIKYLP